MTAVKEATVVVEQPAADEVRMVPDGPQGSRSRRRRRGSSHAWVVVAAALAFTFVAGWALAYGLVVSAVAASSAQQQLHDQLREELGLATAPVQSPIEAGAPVAVLGIAAAGVVDEVVVEGTSGAETAVAVGHARDTVLPGQPGTSVLVGRSITAGAPFAGISALRTGDEVVVSTGQGTFRFRVSAVRHAGDLVAPLASGASRLTLVTSTGGSWRNGWVPAGLVYVDASLVGTPAQGAPRTSVAIADSERVWGVESAAWIAVVLWLQLLLVVLVGLVWLAFRVGGWQAWVIGVPVVLAVLWGLASAAHLLLPNVI